MNSQNGKIYQSTEGVTDDMQEWTNSLFPFLQVWWSPTHTYTQDIGIVSFPFHPCLVPILSLSHSHPTTDFPHLETVSLVHQKPLPLGREMHLLCILWSHTSYNFHPSERGFRFYPQPWMWKDVTGCILSSTAGNDTHPSQHTQEVLSPEIPASRSTHCTPLL